MIPGPKSRALARRLRRVESRNITFLSSTFPVFWERSYGSRVWDVDGNSYLDLSSAFGVASLGHRADIVQRSLHRQSAKMWHGMGDVHPNAVKVELLEALAAITPGDLNVSILSSSGAEAVESALKTARLATGKKRVLAFSGAYHGLSYATLSLSDRQDFRYPFENQLMTPSVIVPYPDRFRRLSEERSLAEVEHAFRRYRDIGAVVVEPIQGRGGVRIGTPLFLQELRKMATRFGALLIADEIFTGFGRTGKMFAVEHSKVVPDLLCLGKALSNGFPISVCIGRRGIMKSWPISNGEAIHTSTFLGNPLGCAMAVASIREIERGQWAARSQRLGSQWQRELSKRLGKDPRVGDIRGQGLMIGIELVKNRKELEPDPRLTGRVVSEALRRGLILLSGGAHRNVLTLTPPLTIAEADLDRATGILTTIMETLR